MRPAGTRLSVETLLELERKAWRRREAIDRTRCLIDLLARQRAWAAWLFGPEALSRSPAETRAPAAPPAVSLRPHDRHAQEVDGYALRAVVCFSRLEPWQAEEAFACWQEEIWRRLPPKIATAVVARVRDLLGLVP